MRNAEIFVNRVIRAEFRAEITRLALRITRHGQAVFDVDLSVAVLVLLREKNEIIDAVIINIARKAERARTDAEAKNRCRSSVPFSRFSIADFKRERADVRTVVVKLFERRSARYEFDIIDDKRAALPEPEIHADPAGKSGEQRARVNPRFSGL